MAERFVSPFARFFTSDLKTLPGALLYFYENGTTTLKPVYQDPFKNTAHANPVVAGTLGASADTFPPIFLDGTYTVELRNSAGAVQGGWPQNNVGGEQIQGQLDDYSAITSYTIGELVTGSDGNRYESTANNNLNNDPTILANRPTYWKQIYIIGEYNSAETYEAGEYITYDGGLFKCLSTATGQNPNTAHAYWIRIHNIPHWSTNATFRANDWAIGSDGETYVSRANANSGNNPVGGTGQWWFNRRCVKASYLSGGGALSAAFPNFITDSSTYTLPAANSLPANFVVQVLKLDLHRAAQPVVNAAGADTITNTAGSDTQIRFDWAYRDAVNFVTDGISNWRC